jgi:hypothetical protein
VRECLARELRGLENQSRWQGIRMTAIEVLDCTYVYPIRTDGFFRSVINNDRFHTTAMPKVTESNAAVHRALARTILHYHTTLYDRSLIAILRSITSQAKCSNVIHSRSHSTAKTQSDIRLVSGVI